MDISTGALCGSLAEHSPGGGFAPLAAIQSPTRDGDQGNRIVLIRQSGPERDRRRRNIGETGRCD